MGALNRDFDVPTSDLFDQFADPCTVTRGAAQPVTSRCIVEDGAARLGEYGQVSGRVRMVSFIKSEWAPARGDIVTIAGDGSVQTVEAIEEDDGLVVKVVVNA